MTEPDIYRLLEFQRLLAEFNQVDRVVHRKHKGNYVYENDIEHSYNLALTVWFLTTYFPKLDNNLVIKYALVHDLVEVHAGDTFAHGDPKLLSTKAVREAAALKQLSKDWADFPEMIGLIKEYEERNSGEAKFVYALDKIMPIMQIYIHEGHSWKEENITADMIYEIKHQKVALSPEIKPYFDALYQLLLDSPHIIQKGKA